MCIEKNRERDSFGYCLGWVLLAVFIIGGCVQPSHDSASTEEEKGLTETKADSNVWPDYITNPTLTSIKIGDSLLVLSRPFQHKNWTYEKDTARIARDQVIKARIEKMTQEHPGWHIDLDLDPNFLYYEGNFLLFHKETFRPFIYFERSGQLMNVDEELSFIYPPDSEIDSCGNRACGVKSPFIDQSILEVIRKNPHLKNDGTPHIEGMFILHPDVSAPTTISYQKIDKVYINYSKEYLSKEGLLGAQGGVVVYDMEGNMILDYFDKKDKSGYLFFLNDDYFATIAMADGSEGCNQCLPYVIKIISTDTKAILYEKVFPRSTDVKTTTDQIHFELPQPVENALLYRVSQSFHDKIEFHLVDLSSFQEWEYKFIRDRNDPSVYNRHKKILYRAYSKYNSGEIDSFEILGFKKLKGI